MKKLGKLLFRLIGGVKDKLSLSLIMLLPILMSGQNLITPTGIVGTFYGSTSQKCIDNSGLSSVPTTVASAVGVTHVSPASISDATYLTNGAASTTSWTFSFSTPQDLQGMVLWQPCSPHNGGDAPFNKILLTSVSCGVTFYDTIVMGLPSPVSKFQYFPAPKFGVTLITLDILEAWVYNNVSTGSCNPSIGWTSTPASSSLSSMYNVMLGEIKFIEATTVPSVLVPVDVMVSNQIQCGVCDTLTVNLVNTSTGISFSSFMINECPDTISLCIDNAASYDLVGSNGTVFQNAITNGVVNYPAGQNIFQLDAQVMCCPIASFSVADLCFGATTSFTNLSNPNGGIIINWQWYFGDGDSLIGVQNPTHLYSASGTYNVILAVTNDLNCTDSFSLAITVNPTYSNNQNISICLNDSVFLNGGFQNTSGVYIDSFQTMQGCDSIMITNLMVDPSYNVSQSQLICSGDSVLFGGNYYSSSGTYIDSLQTVFGCDSIIALNLTVNTSFQFSFNQSICQGDSIFLGGAFQNSSGIYIDSLQATFGCDSIVETTLVVGNTYNDSIAINICQGDSILLGGGIQSSSGIFVDTLQSFLGCDSVVTTNLTVNAMFLSNQAQTICSGDSVLFGGNYYGSSGTYIDSFQTVFGCDSIIALNLTVNPSYQFNFNQTICQGDSILLGGNYQSTTGTYSDTLQTSLGCDSILSVLLTVEPVYNINTSISICQGDSVFLNGSFQTVQGTYVDSFQTVFGCDSITITNLTVNSAPSVVASGDTVIEQGSSVQIGVGGGLSYVWTPDYELSCANCQFPIASPNITTTYVVASSIGGCFSYDTLTITVKKVDVILFVPNTFTPNSDGKNDVFRFYGYGITTFEAMIFDRWGELLFKSIDLSEGWDGTYKGVEVPIGVYVYKVKYVSLQDQHFKKVGSINLLR